MYRKRLLQMGMPADIAGFEYLNHAIQIYKPTQYLMPLYIDVAKKFGATPAQVERSMRHAISRSGDKLTVGQFIAKYKILWEEQ